MAFQEVWPVGGIGTQVGKLNEWEARVLSPLLGQHFLAVAVSVFQLLGQSLLSFQFHSDAASLGYFNILSSFVFPVPGMKVALGAFAVANLGYFTIFLFVSELSCHLY